eukprot:TRINITY_DN3658_c0_g1_i1.p1 TRINITY_DN3658_c0_g1~~TRINITY_DN3658_c0_g1_i1.p1  ORF type:complete len:766 (-),score=97.21 TRINITY_DN3658_c0_g1_i1:114-2102(-)
MGLTFRTFSILLEPADGRTADLLTKWRREVSLHSGIGFRDKLFHVTMAYQRQAISQEFLDDINTLNASLEGVWSDAIKLQPEIVPQSPVLTFFRDMMDFRTLPLFTTNLLLSDFITLRQSQNQMQEKPKPKEIILILGYQVKKSGRPHVIMKNRLKKAVGVYFAKVTEHNQPGRVSFFLTGGYTTGHIESEATVMRRWLLDGYGISPDAILIPEERAQNTVESAYFSKRKLLKEGINTGDITVITSDFHLPRASLVFLHCFAKSSFSVNFVTAPASNEPKHADAVEQLKQQEIELISQTPDQLKTFDKKFTEQTIANYEFTLWEDIKRGNIVGVEYWLKKHSGQINSQFDENGRTPLHVLAGYGNSAPHIQIALLLLKNSANVNAADFQGSRPLHIAAAKGATVMAKMFCEFGAQKQLAGQGPFWKGNLTPPEILSLEEIKQSISEVDHSIMTLGLHWNRTDKKNVFLVRHAESIANRWYGYKKPISILDPRISEAGEKSLSQLREATAPSIQNMKIDLIFVSPLTRALQTCLGIFEQAALAQNIPIIIDERISEHLADISDIGRPKSALMKEFLCPQFKWDKLKELWWYTPQGPSELTPPNITQVAKEPIEHFKQRLTSFWKDLVARPEMNIAVVAHAGVHRVLSRKEAKLRNLEIYPMIV